jgi:hypothetical protein
MSRECDRRSTNAGNQYCRSAELQRHCDDGEHVPELVESKHFWFQRWPLFVEQDCTKRKDDAAGCVQRQSHTTDVLVRPRDDENDGPTDDEIHRRSGLSPPPTNLQCNSDGCRNPDEEQVRDSERSRKCKEAHWGVRPCNKYVDHAVIDTLHDPLCSLASREQVVVSRCREQCAERCRVDRHCDRGDRSSRCHDQSNSCWNRDERRAAMYSASPPRSPTTSHVMKHRAMRQWRPPVRQRNLGE